jgi:hypothetical protein
MGITLWLQRRANSILHYSHLQDSSDDVHTPVWTRFDTLTVISQVFGEVRDLAPRVGCRRSTVVIEHQEPASAASPHDCFAVLLV